jgi:hypothetical protein
MESPIIVVEKERVITADGVLGLLVAVAVVAAVNVLASLVHFAALGIVFTAVTFVLLIIAWRRFLRRVEYDPKAGLITANGVLPFVAFSLPVASIKTIRTTGQWSLDGRGRYNLVLRRNHAIQPLLLEVRTDNEHAQVEQLLARIPADLRSGTVAGKRG